MGLSDTDLGAARGILVSAVLGIPMWLALASLPGCSKDPVGVSATDNRDMRVERMFTHEGCSVYRFYDDGAHYFADCRGSVIQREHRMCGKTTCDRDAEVATNE